MHDNMHTYTKRERKIERGREREKQTKVDGGGVAQQLIVSTVLAEDQSSVHRTHIGWNTSSMKSNYIFWPLRTPALMAT